MLDNILGSVNSFLNEEIICDSDLLPKGMKCNQGVIHYNDYCVNSLNFLMLNFYSFSGGCPYSSGIEIQFNF